jgi:hypothetical protein
MRTARAGKRGKEGARRRGRPRLPAGQAKRASFNTRLREHTKERLEQAAASAGRSLSEEIEFRLEQTLEDERRSGGPRLHALLRLFSGAAALIEARTGKSFLSDLDTYVTVKTAWERMLDAARGPEITETVAGWMPDLGPVPPPDTIEDMAALQERFGRVREFATRLRERKDLGATVADSLLAATKKAEE